MFEWVMMLWRWLFPKPEPINVTRYVTPEMLRPLALAEPLPPPKSWHSAFEDVDPPTAWDAVNEAFKKQVETGGNFAELAMREMERTDRRAQLVAAGLLADAAEADRDQRLEGKMDGWMRRGCPCTDCYARRKVSN